MSPTRRRFCSNATLALFAPSLLRAQPRPRAGGPPDATALTPGAATRVDVAQIDHDRILAAADRYLSQAPAPLTAFPAPHSPGGPNDFFCEASEEKAPLPPPSAPPPVKGRLGIKSKGQFPVTPERQPENPTGPAPFTAHSDALLDFSIQVPALTAAYVLTGEARYATHAANHLRAWFVDPRQRMTPALPYAQLLPGSTNPRPEGVLETVHLAEVAQAISFIAKSDALTADELTAVYAWFAAYLEWLGSSRVALLTRDLKNHHGTSWLLQAAAYARLAPQDSGGARKVPAPTSSLAQLAAPPNQFTSLTALRHQFRTVTLRAQINADGAFPREISTAWPYRFSLFNLDMLAGICDLLTTRFESAWEYELQDGPGMRVAVAHLLPYIVSRGTWPYRADITRFNQLPLRQPSLLLAGRAYSRPEYIALWKTLPPDPTDPVLERSFPIRQPLLWVRRAPAL